MTSYLRVFSSDISFSIDFFERRISDD